MLSLMIYMHPWPTLNQQQFLDRLYYSVKNCPKQTLSRFRLGLCLRASSPYPKGLTSYRAQGEAAKSFPHTMGDYIT